jgi:CheY-like chemotaxis protein
VLLTTLLTVDQREYVETIRTSGEALLVVINDILDFSKIESGKLNLENVEFEIQELLEETAELVAESARQKNLGLQTLVENDVPRVLRGDPGRLRQILLNLLSNAVKFTEAGNVNAVVYFLGQDEGGVRLRVEVTDTGIGISDEALARLFQSFEQADSSTTRQYGGTGLGLAISKRLVELMGGTIGCQSTPGHGSTFWFELALGRVLKIPAPRPIEDRVLRGCRVLVVDDNAVNRRVVKQTLEPLGVSISEAWDGTTAHLAIDDAADKGVPFAAALLDYHMPGTDGLTLAREIRDRDTFPGMALLFLASKRDLASPEEFARLRIGAHLTKPIRCRQLVAELSRAIGQAEQVPAPAVSEIAPLPVARAMKVLVAEDNPVNQRVVKLMLERLGCQVEVAGNGAKALEAWSLGEYELVLMDCQMPVLDGFEATRQIRSAEGAGRHTAIVALTANALAGEREKCLAAGMDDYLAKPVSPQLLADAISRSRQAHQNVAT